MNKYCNRIKTPQNLIILLVLVLTPLSAFLFEVVLFGSMMGFYPPKQICWFCHIVAHIFMNKAEYSIDLTVFEYMAMFLIPQSVW